jgi:hypothetical protein
MGFSFDGSETCLPCSTPAWGTRIGSGGHEWSKGVDDSPHAREAVAARRKAALLRCQTSHGTDEIVGGYAHFNFFGHHIGAQAGKLIQPEAAFESTQVRFDVPALSVGGQYLFFRYRQGSEQRQQKGIGSIIRSHLPHDQTTRDAGVPGQLGVTSAVFSAGFPCDEAVDPVPQGFPGQALRPHPGQSQHHPVLPLGRRVGHREDAKVGIPDHRRSARQPPYGSFQQRLFAYGI